MGKDKACVLGVHVLGSLELQANASVPLTYQMDVQETFPEQSQSKFMPQML